jgi:Domain of unknown function (DUF4394)
MSFARAAVALLLAVAANVGNAQTAVAIDTSNNLIRFELATPGTFFSTVPISGVNGESMLAIDIRPATGQLYGFSGASQLYLIDAITAIATPVGTSIVSAIIGGGIAMDFDPVADRIRITSNLDENVSVNPDTGAVDSTGSTISFATGDVHEGILPNVGGTAFTSSVAGATTTTLFGIDYTTNSLVTLPVPASGQLTTVASLGAHLASASLGFDIVTIGGVDTAYAVLQADSTPGLYTIDLTTGAATLVGVISGNTVLRGVTIVKSPVVTGLALRKVHGAAGTFDLPLSLVATNPTTEPRAGPNHQLIFTFDKAIDGAMFGISEGTSVAAGGMITGNQAIMDVIGVSNAQYFTLYLFNIRSADGAIGGTAAARAGFLEGDVNQNRVVTVADLGLVNAQLTQPVNASNYLKDVNATGTLTVADKGLTNAKLTTALPAP